MDGRLLIVVAGFVVAMAGCRSQDRLSSNMPIPAAAKPGGGSMLERAFASKPSMPSAPPMTIEPALERPKGPLKPETVATFAELEVDAVFNNDEFTPAERERRIDAARQKFRLAIQQDPKNLEALRGLGRLYTRLGDREKACQMYATALQHHPKIATLYHEAALCHGRFENWPQAAALWQQALALDPDSRKYPRLIGLASVRQGQFEDGFAWMMKVMPEAEARTVLAREMLEAGHADASRMQLELAVKADPTFAPAVTALSGIQHAGFQQ
jgi:Tfp pilus assembly protein PilF